MTVPKGLHMCRNSHRDVFHPLKLARCNGHSRSRRLTISSYRYTHGNTRVQREFDKKIKY